MKNILVFLIKICFVLLFFILLLQYIRIDYLFKRSNLSLLILENSSVKNVEILYDRGTLNYQFSIKITFIDGNAIEIDRVNEYGSGNINIIKSNNFLFSIVNIENGIGIDRDKQLNFISFVTGMQMENIFDIITNYNYIIKFVDTLPNLSEHAQDGEKIYDVRQRLLKNNIFIDNIVLFESQYYFISKYEIEVLVFP